MNKNWENWENKNTENPTIIAAVQLQRKSRKQKMELR